MATAASTNGVTALPPLVPLDSNYESAVAFSSYANWLLPGRVMLGRYPHVEPSRCRTRDQGEAQLEAILRAGITTFVSLQEELPPQEQLKIAGKNGFLPYKATAELIHAALQPPPPLEDLHALRNAALNKFLPPKHAKGGSGAAGQQAPPAAPKLVFLHSPIPDLGVPSSEGLRTLVADLAARVRGGEEVLYVHCWGGRGRAGTVGACLVASLYNLTAEESLQRVQRAFDTRRDSERRSPETDEQVQFVQQFVSAQRS